MREVYTGYGHDAAMGYKYRARIEEKKVRKGWPWNRYTVTLYRYVIDCHFMSWGYECSGSWVRDKSKAVEAGHAWLDRKSATSKGEVL